MRIWKVITLLLILAMVGACAPAGETSSTEETSTDSSAPAAAESAAAADKPAPAAPPKPPAPKTATIPAGTTLSVVLSSALDSGKNKAGDKFSGNLSEAIVVDGKTVLEKGTAVEGTVVAADGSGRVSGKASMSLALTSATVKGKELALSTKTHSAEAEGTKGRDAAIIAGGAGVGAAIGAIAGGGKGAAIGAAVGGGSGTGAVLATKGKEVKYAPESKLDFTLDEAVKVTL